MSGCDYNCKTCSSTCDKKDFIIQTNQYSFINKKIGIVSGKGGVGKSLVTSLLASSASKLNYKVAILDGDILGPSIASSFGIKDKAYGDESGNFIYPSNAPLNIDIISSSMLLENEDDPIIWRGSMVSNMVKQFYSNVIYGKQDIMFIDMPPGTGDVPLTIFQSIPLDGIIVVTSPQDLVSMIVEKSVKMAKMMNIPLLALVENYSYIKCPNCNEKISLFGKSKNEEKAKENNIPHFICLPIDPNLTKLVDQGKVYEYDTNDFDDLINDIMK
ncbi:MAG: Mrp/NBP35 family ATP-binding protein [Erysipelotrichaceae bacterium]|nr:Mrp/NBP35 family ATP-binding protein [Erysipelotrichaceae bacterium]